MPAAAWNVRWPPTSAHQVGRVPPNPSSTAAMSATASHGECPARSTARGRAAGRSRPGTGQRAPRRHRRDSRSSCRTAVDSQHTRALPGDPARELTRLRGNRERVRSIAAGRTTGSSTPFPRSSESCSCQSKDPEIIGGLRSARETDHDPRDRARAAAPPPRPPTRPPMSARAATAIDPTAYECAPTGLDAFVDGVVNGLTNEEFFFLVDSRGDARHPHPRRPAQRHRCRTETPGRRARTAGTR